MQRYPLSHPQKRIWYIEQLYPHTSLHNIGGVACFKGSVHFDCLDQAIHTFIRRNEGVRLQIGVEDGEPYQYPVEYSPERLDFTAATRMSKKTASLRT